MTHKITTVIVLLILILGVAWLYLSGKPRTSVPTKPASQEMVKGLKQTLIGSVENVTKSTISLKTGTETKKVTLAADAKIIKDVPTKDGPVKLVDVKISDIKAGNVLVVYFDSVSKTGSEYVANKIEIVSDK